MTLTREIQPMPDFVSAALDETGLRASYDDRPDYQRNDYLGWINKAKREATYTLVAAQEADLKRNRISVESPIGKALLGREVGETVAVRVPAGTVQLEILDITR